MMIRDYTLDVFTPPCSPGAEQHVACIQFQSDISAVLPYLNAVLEGVQYLPEACALTWKNNGQAIVFHAHEINISNLEDRSHAEKIAQDVVNLVNRTWRQRTDIKPRHTAYKRPAPMVLFRLLPQTNCRECGESTCFSFALKLAANVRTAYDCPPLAEDRFAGKRNELMALMQADKTHR